MKKPNKNLPGWMPKQSLGDAIDQLTIVARKLFFGEEDVIEELNYLIECLDSMKMDKHIKRPGKFIVTIIRLTQINFEIWNLENIMRSAPDGRLPGGMTKSEAGERAVEIRDFNVKRKKYLNEINRLTELGFREFKIKHRSQC